LDLLGALGKFVRVVETGSFSAVGRETGTSQSAVTRDISMLEQHFGVRLLHRTTRRLSLTDDGETLLPHARQLITDAEAMEGILGSHRAAPIGLVRVGVFAASGQFLAPRLPRLLARHPGLSVDLIVRDRFGDLIEEQLDLAFHRGDIPDSSLVARLVGVYGEQAVASPAYLDRHGTPSEPSELADRVCIVRHDLAESGVWRFTGPDGPLSVRVAGSLRTNNAHAALLASRDGHGIALLPEILIADDIRAGRLIALLPDYPSQQVPLHLVYPSRRNLPPRTRLVIDFILHEMRALTVAAARELTREALPA
jgi:DNA-binding transcriptional LysR family regulator